MKNEAENNWKCAACEAPRNHEGRYGNPGPFGYCSALCEVIATGDLMHSYDAESEAYHVNLNDAAAYIEELRAQVPMALRRKWPQ